MEEVGDCETFCWVPKGVLFFKGSASLSFPKVLLQLMTHILLALTFYYCLPSILQSGFIGLSLVVVALLNSIEKQNSRGF